MSDENTLIAQQVVSTEQAGTLTVRIFQHAAEDFWQVDFSEGCAPLEARLTTTVAPGDSFMMYLIEAAVSGEAVAWRHLAHWGHDAIDRTSRPAALRPA